MTDRKMNLLAYAITGKEFVAMDDLTRYGIDHWRGVRIEFERRGKQRTAEPHEYPAIHNYIWLRPEPEQMRHLSGVRFLGSTFHFLGKHAIADLKRFQNEVEAKEQDARAIIAEQQRALEIAKDKARDAESKRAAMDAQRAMIKASLAEYNAGDKIIIRDGVLAGEMATFKRLVQGAKDVFPFVEAEMEMLGRITTVKIDPLAVRRAATA